jgi:hypothetical protein
VLDIVYFGNTKSLITQSINKYVSQAGYNSRIVYLPDELRKARKNNKFLKLPIIRTIYTFFLLHGIFINLFSLNNRRNQIAHIHYVGFAYIFVVPFLVLYFSKIIISFWGSDLYSEKKMKLKLMFPLYIVSNYIGFITNEMQLFFNRQVCPCFNDKYYIHRFGLEVLNYIDGITDLDVLSFKERMTIPHNKKCIAVGYNKSKNQQHVKVIQSINTLPQAVTDNIVIIIPWIFGEDTGEYKTEIIKNLENVRYEYLFIEEFMSNFDIACFRRSTDILIQVQKTDALSGSMQETLYAGKTVITGKWLPYNILYEQGIIMYTVNSCEEIASSISMIMNNFPNESVRNKENVKIIGDLSKWEFCIKTLTDMYAKK